MYKHQRQQELHHCSVEEQLGHVLDDDAPVIIDGAAAHDDGSVSVEAGEVDLDPASTSGGRGTERVKRRGRQLCMPRRFVKLRRSGHRQRDNFRPNYINPAAED